VPKPAVTGFPPLPARPRAALQPRPPAPLAPRLFADLIGKPWAEGGRGPDAYDCVGLVLEVAKRLGKQLPDYVSNEATLHAELAAGGDSLADLPRMIHPNVGDVVLLRMGVNEHHLGVMVDSCRMLHASRNCAAIIERVNSPLWQRRVMGYYALLSAAAPAKGPAA